MGRAQESYGEDTFHVGEMGKASTRGVQRHNVMACVKHFALNNQENTRFSVDCTGDERALREVYLEHFRQIVQVGGAASVMVCFYGGKTFDMLLDVHAVEANGVFFLKRARITSSKANTVARTSVCCGVF